MHFRRNGRGIFGRFDRGCQCLVEAVFSDIRPWKASNVDDGRVTWLHFYGIPYHAWCSDLFVYLENLLGAFVCIDKNTASEANVDIARIMVRVPVDFIMKDSVLVLVDGVEFTILMREGSYGPLRLWKDSNVATKASSLSSSKESWGNSDRALGEKKNDNSSEGAFSAHEEEFSNKDSGVALVPVLGEGEESNSLSNSFSEIWIKAPSTVLS